LLKLIVSVEKIILEVCFLEEVVGEEEEVKEYFH
jgi:hypothetical protein